MKKLFAFASVIALFCYPFLVYYGLTRLDLMWVSLLIIVIFALRLSFIRGKNPLLTNALVIISVFSIGLSLLGWLNDNELGIRSYPIVTNLVMLGVFLYSLFTPTSIIERLARITEPDLNEHGILYTRRVTQVWCGFFVINGAIAAYTAFYTSLETWTLYNGLIAYIAMGCLFVIEYLCRITVRK